MLARVIDTVGPEKVIFGTDYPYDMGDYRPHGFLEAAVSDANARSAILGGNAAALLGL